MIQIYKNEKIKKKKNYFQVAGNSLLMIDDTYVRTIKRKNLNGMNY